MPYFPPIKIMPIYSVRGAKGEDGADGDVGTASIINKTGSYLATTADNVIDCDATSGAITITLPTAVGNTGKIYTIKKNDSSTNTVTVDANAAETIDGTLTKIITTQYTSMTIISDGSNWLII